ncbi:MAG TPA: methyltransferase domain-containing protein [Pseudolabrys sp.]|nr:methyltransferase domain-containing protein [Pseudolabrys sp.]
MNRRQRRAALKQNPPGAAATAAGDVRQLFALAMHAQAPHRLDEAARTYRRVLAQAPDHAEASNNLGCVLQAQGKLAEASACFAQALTLVPQLADNFRGLCAALQSVLPPLAAALARADATWPRRLSLDELFGGDTLGSIEADPFLLRILATAPVRDIAFERMLTSLRRALLGRADAPIDLACGLARQCFLNEYVFESTAEEDARVAELKTEIERALTAGVEIAPARLASLAMYAPLHALDTAQALSERAWPAPLDGVVTQQLREPRAEQDLRASMPRLTEIEDAVSLRVRAQYEANPYPRWTRAAGAIQPTGIDRFLREQFPTAAFAPLHNEAPDILVAGCGTGWQTTGIAQQFAAARITAVDLSVASLAYAKRNTPAALAARIHYAQADILKLGTLERRFDIVYATGVLHHMADPFAAWRVLLGLLKSGGVMNLGLYSELARRDVAQARAFIAQRGYTASPPDIRRCRQELAGTPLRSVARFNDFFSLSECRDLLFHVQESNTTIAHLQEFIAAQKLKFIGFEFPAAAQRHYRALFAQNGWPIGDLGRWHEVETKFPDTFAGMYHFWIQKP